MHVLSRKIKFTFSKHIKLFLFKVFFLKANFRSNDMLQQYSLV